MGPAGGLLAGVREGGIRNTDEHPIVGWLAARHADRARRGQVDELLAMLERMSAGTPPDWPGLDSVRWRGFRLARDAYVGALAAAVEGRREEAEAGLWKSVAASSEFPSAYSHLLGESMAEMRTQPESARARLRKLASMRPETPVAEELLRRINVR